MILFPLTRHQRGVLSVKYPRPKSDLIHISFLYRTLKMQQTDAFIHRVWEENVIDCLKLFLVNILGSGGF